jgi:excisionase family DNA binding protein
MTGDRLLPVRTVAKRLNFCEETIRRYIRRGLLKAHRPAGDRRAGNYLIAESAVREFLATSCDTHPS